MHACNLTTTRQKCAHSWQLPGGALSLLKKLFLQQQKHPTAVLGGRSGQRPSAEAEAEGLLGGGPGLLQGLGNAQRGEGEPEQRERDQADAHRNEHQAAKVVGDYEIVGRRRRDEIELCRAHRVDGAPENVAHVSQRSSWRSLRSPFTDILSEILKRSVEELQSKVVISTAIEAEGSTVSLSSPNSFVTS